MAKMFHKPTRSANGQKAYLATPTYGGLCAGFCFSMFHSAEALKDAGISYELALWDGDCHVDDSRNRLVRDFLETDCTDLVFIDADLLFEPQDLVKLLKYDKDVVGGTYPFKQEEQGFPVAMLSGDAVADENGLVKVQGLPTGFLRIKRHVLQKLADDAVKFKQKSDSRSDIPLIFERQVFNGFRRGGDYAFCYKWREMGGELFLAPELYFEHYGQKSWKGSFGHWKRTEMYGAIKAGVMEIKAGLESDKTIGDMLTEWGSGWAAPKDMLWGLCCVAKTLKGDVLETGSGISSIILAASSKGTVYSLEHDDAWADKVEAVAKECGLDNLVILRRPLKDGWYDHTVEGKYDLVLCDGPPRMLGDRKKLFEYDLKGSIIFVDDINTPRYIENVRNLKDHDVVEVGRFAICKPKGE